MKHLLLLLFISISSFAQVGIHKDSVDGDGILDFNENATGGIVLPCLTSTPTGAAATNGTFYFDYATKNVLVRENSVWKSLSLESGNSSSIYLNTSSDVGSGVIIGSNSSSATGVLVLESSSKALILPKIEKPHLTITSPHPGTICYDTFNKCIAVFNGSHWYFWK